jgi:hypothetical protein
MSYKTKYKEALKAANITEADLMPKTKELLETVKQLQLVVDSEQEDKEASESLSVLDADLCKKIARNESTKANVAKMQAARGKNKQVTPIPTQPVIAPTVDPVVESVVDKKEEVEKVEETESNALGWIAGLGLSAIGVIVFGKWQKWF